MTDSAFFPRMKTCHVLDFWRIRWLRNLTRFFETGSTLCDDGFGIFFPDENVPCNWFLADAVSNIPRQVCHLTRWEEVSRSWGRNKTDTAHEKARPPCSFTACAIHVLEILARKKLLFCRQKKKRIFPMNGGCGKTNNGWGRLGDASTIAETWSGFFFAAGKRFTVAACAIPIYRTRVKKYRTCLMRYMAYRIRHFYETSVCRISQDCAWPGTFFTH